MQKYGVVFDFNGTLFWDTKLQNDSWDHFLHKYGFNLDEEQKNKYVHGINAKDTFEYLFKRYLSVDEVYNYTEEKEVVYREMCLESGMELAPGAKDLIEYLLTNNVKIAIATASAKNNVDFFIEQFDLLRFFKPENIIYNDGTLRGKPHPDLFTKAIKVIGVPANRVTIFEDSLAGVEAAKNSGAGNVVIVNGSSDIFKSYNYQIINHFNQFSRKNFQ